MKSPQKLNCLILITLGIVFVLSLNIHNPLILNPDNKYTNNKILKTSRISDSIYINNNWTDAKNAGIVTGSGIRSDPYIIEDLIIDANGSDYGIKIMESNESLIIKNCTISNTRNGSFWSYFGIGGIILTSVNNTQLINNNCSLNFKGIHLDIGCRNITINGNYLKGNRYGIYSDRCKSINITGNTIYNNGHGIFLGECVNVIIAANTVNNSTDGGINFYGNNYDIFENVMINCGLHFELLYLGDEILIEDIFSYKIDNTNLVNGRPIYFYKNKSNLGPSNFTNAGQVFLVNCSDSIISNLNISNADAGISVYLSNKLNISENTVNNILHGGISLMNSHYNNITRNTVNNIESNGIYLDNCDHNNISDNIISNTTYYWGIWLPFCDYNDISGNFINNCGGGMSIEGVGNIISGNTLNNNHESGLSIEGENNVLSGNIMDKWGLEIRWDWDTPERLGSHNIDDSNLLNGKPIYYYTNENNLGSKDFTNASQIFLFNCINSLISDLNISYCTIGITLYFCENIIISGNNLNNNDYGIKLRESFYNDIIGNSLSNNDIGIHTWDCENNDIVGNTVNNNTVGLDILFSSLIYISGNIANDNEIGISVALWGDNIISGNTVNNNQIGIYIIGEYFTIIGNNVSNNEYGIFVDFLYGKCSHTHMIIDNVFYNNIHDYYEEKWCQISGSIVGYYVFAILSILVFMSFSLIRKLKSRLERG